MRGPGASLRYGRDDGWMRFWRPGRDDQEILSPRIWSGVSHVAILILGRAEASVRGPGASLRYGRDDGWMRFWRPGRGDQEILSPRTWSGASHVAKLILGRAKAGVRGPGTTLRCGRDDGRMRFWRCGRDDQEILSPRTWSGASHVAVLHGAVQKRACGVPALPAGRISQAAFWSPLRISSPV